MKNAGLEVSVRPAYWFQERWELEKEKKKAEKQMRKLKEKLGGNLGKYLNCDWKVPEAKGFKSFTTLEQDGYSNQYVEALEEVGITSKSGRDIIWAVPIQHDELAGSYGAYGNQPTVEYFYSAAAIIVNVPSWDVRKDPSYWEKGSTFEDGNLSRFRWDVSDDDTDTESDEGETDEGDSITEDTDEETDEEKFDEEVTDDDETDESETDEDSDEDEEDEKNEDDPSERWPKRWGERVWNEEWPPPRK
ncbi:hypothetical protein HDV00_010605 [Rhizophlyctis rosea]|nr:hypothetical protein HDV00_010605 [Rhizophlyctis rosea]